MRYALLLVVAIACRSKHAPRTHQVAIRGMQFVPARLDVDAGDTVMWTNEDVLPHTVTSQGIFDSLAMTPKQVWGWSFMQPGDWPYGCSFHPTMHGVIVAH